MRSTFEVLEEVLVSNSVLFVLGLYFFRKLGIFVVSQKIEIDILIFTSEHIPKIKFIITQCPKSGSSWHSATVPLVRSIFHVLGFEIRSVVGGRRRSISTVVGCRGRSVGAVIGGGRGTVIGGGRGRSIGTIVY